ncbi:recombinase family protein [Priestia flexa]|uniref:recombinase family protein n=1 Tax=Priestia flexa TaxID=86664 RepID=UPI00209E120E|nr:recombinase family protein [Priestia flexa]MCP1190828.1 recombinase family protein [Priestia flexa]
MKKTVIYVRRSLNEMKQKTSIPYQINTCRDFAEKQGWIVHEVFNEGEKSARSSELEERKEIWRLMKEVKSGFIERIIVFKRDRISRRADQYMEFVELLRAHKVTMYFAGDNEPQMFDGVVGDFIELLFGAISEHEGNNITQRLIQSRIAKVREGEWGGGRPPKFYHIEEIKTDGEIEKKLMITNNNKEKIKDIYEFVANSDFKTVKEASVSLKGKRPSFKNIDLVEFIPKELHKGWMTATYEGIFIRSKAVNPRIKAVEEKLWNAANEKLIKMEDAFFEKEVITVNPKLEKVLFCSRCKNQLSSKQGYYFCPNHKLGLRISVELLDNQIIKAVHSRIGSHVAKNKAEIVAYITQELITPLEIACRENEKALENAQDMLQKMTSVCIANPSKYKTGEEKKKFLKSYVDGYKECFQKLKLTKIKLEENRERISLSLNKMLPVPTIHSLSNYKQKELLRFYIERIEVDTDLHVKIIYRTDMRMNREESK